MLFDLMSQLQI